MLLPLLLLVLVLLLNSVECYPGGRKIDFFLSISEILLPLCSVYQKPSNESNLTLLAWFLPEFAYSSMLFILELVCSAHSVRNGASKVRLDS